VLAPVHFNPKLNLNNRIYFQPKQQLTYCTVVTFSVGFFLISIDSGTQTQHRVCDIGAQGCCLIALQLARFLLCGEVDESTSTASLKLPTTPAKLQLTPTKISPIRLLGAGVTTPLKTSLLSLSPTKLSASPGVGGAAQGVGGGGSAPASYTFSPVKENTEETARAAIQVLERPQTRLFYNGIFS